MKRLIAILGALCMLSGFPKDCVYEVVDVFSNLEYSAYEKAVAIEVVSKQLEDLYDCLANGENPYAKNRNCNVY